MQDNDWDSPLEPYETHGSASGPQDAAPQDTAPQDTVPRDGAFPIPPPMPAEVEQRVKRGVSTLGFVPGCFLMFFGSIFLIVGFFAYRSLTASSSDVVVDGIVVDVRSSRDDDGDLQYSPIVEYVDETTGQTYTATSVLRTSWQPEIGEVREVAYNPNNPSDGKVVGSTWFPLIFLTIGGLVFLGGLVLLFVAARMRRRLLAT